MMEPHLEVCMANKNQQTHFQEGRGKASPSALDRPVVQRSWMKAFHNKILKRLGVRHLTMVRDHLLGYPIDWLRMIF